MAKINRSALRFGLTVAGVAFGTIVLGHLMPTQSPANAPVEAQSAQGGQPSGAQPAAGDLAASGMLVKNTASGGRLIILGHTDSEPTITVDAIRQSETAPGLPPVRTRRS